MNSNATIRMSRRHALLPDVALISTDKIIALALGLTFWMINEPRYHSTFSSETERRDSSSTPPNWETRKKTKRSDKRRRKNMKRPWQKYVHAKNKSDAKEDSNYSSSPIESSPVALEAARIKPSVHREHTIFTKGLHDGTRWKRKRRSINKSFFLYGRRFTTVCQNLSTPKKEATG